MKKSHLLFFLFTIFFFSFGTVRAIVPPPAPEPDFGSFGSPSTPPDLSSGSSGGGSTGGSSGFDGGTSNGNGASGSWGGSGQDTGSHSGQDTGIHSVTLPNPLGINTFEDFVSRLLSGMLYIAVPLVTLMIIWGAFQMLFSAGDEGKFASGRKTIVYAIIGLIVVLSAEGIVAVLRTIFS